MLSAAILFTAVKLVEKWWIRVFRVVRDVPGVPEWDRENLLKIPRRMHKIVIELQWCWAVNNSLWLWNQVRKNRIRFPDVSCGIFKYGHYQLTGLHKRYQTSHSLSKSPIKVAIYPLLLSVVRQLSNSLHVLFQTWQPR